MPGPVYHACAEEGAAAVARRFMLCGSPSYLPAVVSLSCHACLHSQAVPAVASHSSLRVWSPSLCCMSFFRHHQVDPIVASFCGGGVGVLTALLIVEANNAKMQVWAAVPWPTHQSCVTPCSREACCSFSRPKPLPSCLDDMGDTCRLSCPELLASLPVCRTNVSDSAHRRSGGASIARAPAT